MNIIISIVIMLVSGYVGFVLGGLVSEGDAGMMFCALMFALISGVACIINAINKTNKKK